MRAWPVRFGGFASGRAKRAFVGVLRALIFDFDGTIAETERNGHRVAYNAAFEALGLADRWDEETYGELLAVAGGRERLEFYFARAHPERDERARAKLARDVHATKRRLFDDIGPTLQPRPGVERLVDEATAAGVRVAIATTAAPEGVRAFFAGHPAIGRAFHVIVGGDDVPAKKPSPDIYNLALERLGVSASDALAIEDSTIGLRAARAAGLATLVTPSGYTLREDFTSATAVRDDLSLVDLAFCRGLVA
jgi:HAD superfamily hydrolase (TIGR01509 family)